jgi:hypothetical protein
VDDGGPGFGQVIMGVDVPAPAFVTSCAFLLRLRTIAATAVA